MGKVGCHGLICVSKDSKIQDLGCETGYDTHASSSRIKNKSRQVHSLYGNKENDGTHQGNFGGFRLSPFTSQDLNGICLNKKARVDINNKDTEKLSYVNESIFRPSLPPSSAVLGKSSCIVPTRSALCNVTNTIQIEETTHKANLNKVAVAFGNFKQFTNEDLNAPMAKKRLRKRDSSKQIRVAQLSKQKKTPEPRKKINKSVGCAIGAPVNYKSTSKLIPADFHLNRNLFEHATPEEEGNCSINFHELEKSVIDGYQNLDDDFLCDDECDYNVNDEHNLVGEKVTTNVQSEYASLGGPSIRCQHCDTFMWKEERVNKCVTRGAPKFSLCCRKGQIVLPKNPPTPSYLWQLYNDPKKGKHFQKCSRIYNSMFAFTLSGGTVDNSINNGGSPYVYRLNGQNHHVFGALIPDDGQAPKFCQLYIYDTENEISNRMQWVDVENFGVKML